MRIIRRDVRYTILLDIITILHMVPSIADLVPRENVEAWLKYLKNEFPVVAFKASTQSQNENLVSKLLDREKSPIK